MSKQFPITKNWRETLTRQQLGPLVVDKVDLQIRYGELFGLLGPNGAGKTTLIKMLCTLVIPTSGQARVNGFSLEQDYALRRSIGLVTSDERSFFWRLSARENLEFFASLYGLSDVEIEQRVDASLKNVDLHDAANQRFQTYSSGMRQRLAIARALLNRPRLLFMDEPSKGLDPNATHKLYQLIENLRDQENITIFMTTHNLAEAERLCERLAIMHHGQILACGSTNELRSELNFRSYTYCEVGDLPATTRKKIEDKIVGLAIQPISPKDGSETGAATRLAYRAQEDRSYLDVMIDILRGDQVSIKSISHQPAPLEEIFRSLTNHERQPEAPGVASLEQSQQFHLASDQKTHGNTPSQNLKIIAAFLKRDFRMEASYRLSFLLQAISIFLSVIIFYFVAQLIGNTNIFHLEAYGGDYFSFVLIGIAFSSYFGVGLTSFSQSIRQAQSSGTMEAILSTPIHLSTMIFASSIWQYLLTTIRVLVYLLFGSFLIETSLNQGNYLGAVVILILTVLAFSSLGIIAASFIMVIKRGDPITWLFNSISGLLGGVYYPISILPEWLQWFAKLLPVTYSLEAMRLALLQGASFSVLLPDMMALVVFNIVLIPISLVSFQYAVHQAKIDGSLTHY